MEPCTPQRSRKRRLFQGCDYLAHRDEVKGCDEATSLFPLPTRRLVYSTDPPPFHCGLFLFYRWSLATPPQFAPPDLSLHLADAKVHSVPFNLSIDRGLEGPVKIKPECVAMSVGVHSKKDHQKMIDSLTTAYGCDEVKYCRYMNGANEMPSSAAMWLPEEPFPFTREDHKFNLDDFVQSKNTRIIESLTIMVHAMEKSADHRSA